MDEIIKNLDAYEIQQYQQDRYPCFFVDGITESLPGKYAKVLQLPAVCFSGGGN